MFSNIMHIITCNTDLWCLCFLGMTPDPTHLTSTGKCVSVSPARAQDVANRHGLSRYLDNATKRELID